MPQPRLKMKKIIQILRRHFDLLQKFKESNLNWDDVKELSEDQLEEMLYTNTSSKPP